MRFFSLFLLFLGATPGVVLAQVSSSSGFDSGANPLRVVFGLIIVLGVIAAFAWLMKRFNHVKMGGRSVVKIVGGVNLGSRERLVVVEVAGHWIVTGVTQGSISSLGSFKLSDIKDSSHNIADDIQFDEHSDLNQAETNPLPKDVITSVVKERFRFQSGAPSENQSNLDKTKSMASPALTELFKKVLKK